MIWLAVIGILAILLFCPIYLYCEYLDGFVFSLRLLGIKLRINLGNKPKKQEKPKQKTEKKKKPLKDELSEILSLIKNAKKHILSAFCVTTLNADITVGTGDPCDTALAFGGINLGVTAIVTLLASLVKIKKKQVNVNADYNNKTVSCTAKCVLRTNVIKLLYHGILFVLGITNDKEN